MPPDQPFAGNNKTADENLNENAQQAENSTEYQAPAIEEVVNREGLEREVAYAGLIGGSQIAN